MARCQGFVCEASTQLFLKSCLKASAPAPAFCVDVPPRDDIMGTVRWALGACTARHAAEPQQCQRLLTAWQEHCHAGT